MFGCASKVVYFLVDDGRRSVGFAEGFVIFPVLYMIAHRTNDGLV
jgi:hypothetical protein